jgi:hypothetical protein
LRGALNNQVSRRNLVVDREGFPIGLIFDIPHENICSVGNAAGLGSQFALFSGEAKREPRSSL